MKRGGVFLGVLCIVGSAFASALIFPTASAQGEGWGTAELIEHHYAGDAFAPDVGMDAAGNAIAVWNHGDGGRVDNRASRYAAGVRWAPPVLIESEDNGDASVPRIAVNPSGDAVAAWVQSDGSFSTVWANFYVVGAGWGAAGSVNPNGIGAYDPEVAIDGAGNAFATWVEYAGGWSIFANRYAVGTGWGSPEPVGNTGDSIAPNIAVDSSGNAMIVWEQPNGPVYEVWSKRYVVGTGWETPELFDTAGPFWRGPTVAVDPGGNATALWGQWNGTVLNLLANRYVVGTGWGTAVYLEESDLGNVNLFDVAVDPSGNAVAVWSQWDGARNSVYANRYVVGTGWGTAVLIEATDLEAANWPRVAVDASGNAVAVWYQFSSIWSNRYAVGTGWGTAEFIAAVDPGQDYEPHHAIDPGGNATVVWSAPANSFYSIWSKRYTVGAGWGSEELVELDPYDVTYPDLAVDPSGNAVAVWSQTDGEVNSLWANRYVVGTGWGTPERVEPGPGSPSGDQVAVDSSGNAVAVWYQFDGVRNNIRASRYVVGAGWGTPELVETDDTGDADSPQVAVDASGNAVAVWQQWNATQINIWANRYVVGTGWGTPELLDTEPGVSAAPQVAVDPSGNAIAVWYQNDGIQESAWANRYVVDVGWGTAERIEMDDTGDTASPRIAVDAAGNAIAVWQQWDGATFWDIWANRYVVGAGWGPGGPIDTEYSGDGNAEVAMDAGGNATVVWVKQEVDSPFYRVVANRYVVGTGWGTPGVIQTNDSFSVPSVHVSANSYGSAFAVWAQRDGTLFNIWANRYDSKTGWATAKLIEISDTGDADSPLVAVDSSGNAVAVWRQFDGAFWDLWANRYAADLTPPIAHAGPDQVVTAGTLVTFDGSGSTDNDAIVNYTWEFDDGGPRTLFAASPTYRFDNIGAFVVTLSIRDAAGNSDTDAVVITVNPPPDTERPVAHAGPDQVVTAGTLMTFDGSGSTDNQGIVTYAWTFDDGGLRTLWGVSPKYTFYGPGVFVVTLTVEDAAGNSDTDTVVITVNPPPDTERPVADAGPDQSVAVGGVVTFDGSGSTDNVGISNYTWTFDDGGARTLYTAAPTYRFDNAGIFVVTLAVRDAAGNAGSDVVVITVAVPPDTEPPVANAGPDQTVFVDAMVLFDGTASTDNVGIVNHTWTFNDRGPQVRYAAMFAHGFDEAGAYTVTLTVRDAAGNSDADAVVITVVTRPPPPPPPDTEPPVANAGTDQFVSVGTLVAFNGSASRDNVGIVNYTWTFDDGETRTLYGVSPTYRFVSVGVFVVTLMVRDARANSDSDVVVIAVTAPPDTEPPVAEAGVDRTIFAGTTIVLDGSASTDNVGIVNYSWSFNDGGPKVRYTEAFAYTFSNVGTFTVVLLVRDAAGNIDSDTVVITVLPRDTEPPVAEAGPNQAVTVGTTVAFDGSGSTDNDAIVNYTWTFDDGGQRTLFGASPTYRFENVGAFVVILAVRDAAGNSDSDAVIIAVTSPPDTEPPVAKAGRDQAVFSDETAVLDGTASTDNVGVTNYSWTFVYNGTTHRLYGPIASFRFAATGSYAITLAVKDDAGNVDSDVITVTSSSRPGGTGAERQVVPPVAIIGIGAIAVLEAALAFRFMYRRSRGRGPERRRRARRERGREREGEREGKGDTEDEGVREGERGRERERERESEEEIQPREEREPAEDEFEL